MSKKNSDNVDMVDLSQQKVLIQDTGEVQDFGSDEAILLNREKSVALLESVLTVRHKSLNMREKATDQREGAADQREGAADVRENTADVRETTADVRENTADVRENTADVRDESILEREKGVALREGEIKNAETLLSEMEAHLIQLQELNAHLSVDTKEKNKRLEEVEEDKVQLETAKIDAEKASIAKSEFFIKLSHDLRTPLNAILGFTQLLQRSSPLSLETHARWLNHINNAGNYLLKMINGVLDLATIEAGWASLKRESLPLGITILECLAMVELQAKKRNISIKLIPFDKTWSICADPVRVKQILLNLLSNAIKYNRQNGSVEVKCTRVLNNIRITIKDTGMGLPAEKVAQLFQPFNRLGQEAGDEEGTGIGLVVTKQLVELMGGTINVTSTVGVGSEFWIELQLVEAP